REAPDCDDSARLASFFAAIVELRAAGLALAYHDRSDGGLFATVAEMAFAGHCGVELDLTTEPASIAAALYSEELGAVLQIRSADAQAVRQVLERHGLARFASVIGRVTSADRIVVRTGGKVVLDETRTALRRAWSETSFRMVELRDNPECAREQFAAAIEPGDPGMNVRLTFPLQDDIAAPYISRGARPKVAILREQGVNSHVEMAAAFHRAGFTAYDVHMTDLFEQRLSLDEFRGLVVCGGFSYGDVLGAGEGWAKSILFHSRLRDAFSAYFARPDTFALGVCNGCQMMSALGEIIPGTQHWPRFVRNRSEQFEGRLSLVEVVESPSLFFAGMAGSRMPIAVAHGEGRAEFAQPHALDALVRDQLLSLRFVENDGRPAQRYPANPNGSPRGLTGITTPDGRVTLLMPHPERVYRTAQNSWHPEEWGEDSPWMRIYRNARAWVG
ncbi:MAG TPA: phosphoribosylformylglycinamidine synthase subunit PurQ, partial [Steroidobacteraceae bacterium]|nr:phosphoribosylformylglycinamidine synthase subunit PurQ [Steroidobacteraceae bacterium]